MASKESSKRSSPGDEGGATADPAVKRARSGAGSVGDGILAASGTSSAQAGAGRSTRGTRGLPAVDVDHAPAADGAADAEANEVTTPDFNSDASDEMESPIGDDDDDDFEDWQDMRERIRSCIDAGSTPAFAVYAGPVLDMDDDYDGQMCLESLSLLMKTHDSKGPFWPHAWPIKVYAGKHENRESFDTPWFGAYPADDPPDVSADNKARSKWFWWLGLKSFRDAGATQGSLTEFAKYYDDAMKQATRGLQSIAPEYADQGHAEYLNALKKRVADNELRGSWIDGAGRLRAVFGSGAGDELDQIYNIMKSEADIGAGASEGPVKDERKIWWKYLLPAVLARSTNPAWFQAQLQYIQTGQARFPLCEWTQDLKACEDFARGVGTHEAMCTELEAYITDLRSAYISLCDTEWKPMVRSGTDRAHRTRRYLVYRVMERHFHAGGLPYYPGDIDARPLYAYGLVEGDAAAAKAKADADFGGVWNIALANASYDAAADLTALQELKATMDGADSPYGHEFATKLRKWETLISKVENSSLNTESTGFRFRDIRDRAMEFKAKFGQFPGCESIKENAPSQENCELLADKVETFMFSVDQTTWWKWFDLVFTNFADEEERTSLGNSRNLLNRHGYYWAPHEPVPLLPKRGRQAEDLTFDGARSRLGGSWIFKGTAGAGNFGHAGIWERTDGIGGGVADRIVIKESYQGDSFGTHTYWDGKLYRRVIKEYSLTKSLTDLPNSKHIVKPLAFAVYEHLRMYRVYMEYCAHGDLENAIKKVSTGAGRIPERQIWSIFEALVSALCLMNYGGLPGTGQPDHTTILHRDIKPQNVFLGEVQADNWQGIPIAKLGDFGLVTRVGDQGAQSVGLGTRQYCSPEQQHGANVPPMKDRNPDGMSAKSDLWAVARIILSLMNLEECDDIRPFRFDSLDDQLEIKENLRNSYSELLCTTVTNMLKMESRDRPSAADVWDTIQHRVNTAFPPRGTMKSGGAPAGEAPIYIAPERYANFAWLMPHADIPRLSKTI